MGSIIVNDHSGFIKRNRKINENGLIETVSTQDVSDIIKQNKIDQLDSDFRNGYTPDGDLKHVGRVPLVMWEHWWREECKRRGRSIPIFGREMEKVIREKLNARENKFLRTGGGRL